MNIIWTADTHKFIYVYQARIYFFILARDQLYRQTLKFEQHKHKPDTMKQTLITTEELKQWKMSEEGRIEWGGGVVVKTHFISIFTYRYLLTCSFPLHSPGFNLS